MPLSENIQDRLRSLLVQDALLAAELTDQVVKDLDRDSPIKWNLILNKQLEIEKGGSDEADH